MLSGSQKSVIAPESDPCKWVAVAHYQLCVTAENLDSFKESLSLNLLFSPFKESVSL